MSLSINRTLPNLPGADASHLPPLPAGMRQMQAAPEAIREDTENDILIIPLVALREGVFQCATCPAPELYLAEQFGRITDAWNDRMVTIGHPQISGRFVSAGTAGIWERDGIGRIKNARVENKKLKVEAHIDMGKVAELGSDAIDLIERIRRGEQIDVSVGAFVESVEQFGAFEGKSFAAVQTNYVPDHVAILPVGVKGACSWRDGCGAPRVNQGCACGGSGRCQCAGAVTIENQPAQPISQSVSGRSPSMVDAQLGDRTRREMLHTALATKESGFFVIIQVFDDHLVYRNEREQMLRRDFSIDEDSGTVTISDETVEGTLVSEFMPITVQEEPDMERNKAVDQLIAAESNAWAEGDRAFLMGVDDGQFAKLAANAEPKGQTQPAAHEDVDRGQSAAAPAAVGKPAVKASESPAPAPAARQEPVTVESYIAAAPDPIREWLGEGLATLQKERGDLVKRLISNERCPYTEQELLEKRTDELRKLAEFVRAAPPSNNYAGQAPVSAAAAGVPAAYKKLPDTPAWPT